MKATKFLTKTTFGLFVVSLIFSSCTKYDNPVTEFDEYTEVIDSSTQKKVLLIVVEGAVGSDIQNIKPTNISKLLEHSKYSWTGLSEVNSGDATTWASLTTGVSADKHQIEDESFIRNTGLDNTQVQIPFFPTIFFQLNETRPDLETVTVTSWDPLNDLLLIHANKRIDVTTDAEAKDAIIDQLHTSDPSLALVSFKSVLDAGSSNGFSNQNSEYVEAINTVDGYIGEIVESLEERENYTKEDWLIIITSNHGGIDTTYGGSSDQERNIFSMFYHPKYEPLELKGKTLFTERFNNSTTASAMDPDGIYDIGGENTDLTVEFQMKLNPNVSGTYDYGGWNKLFGKKRWAIYREGNNTDFFIATDNESNRIQRTGSNLFADGKWHTLALVMSLTNKPSRLVNMYYDGVLVATGEDSSTGLLSAPTDLTPIGIGGSSADFNIAEIRIWNKVLADFQLAENACLTEISTTHPNYANLIGYWPAQEEGTELVNLIEGKPNFVITNPTEFSASSNSLPCDLGASNVSIENTSIIPQIYYWFGIPIQETWGLDGQTFLSKFELELE